MKYCILQKAYGSTQILSEKPFSGNLFKINYNDVLFFDSKEEAEVIAGKLTEELNLRDSSSCYFKVISENDLLLMDILS